MAGNGGLRHKFMTRVVAATALIGMYVLGTIAGTSLVMTTGV